MSYKFSLQSLSVLDKSECSADVSTDWSEPNQSVQEMYQLTYMLVCQIIIFNKYNSSPGAKENTRIDSIRRNPSWEYERTRPR